MVYCNHVSYFLFHNKIVHTTYYILLHTTTVSVCISQMLLFVLTTFFLLPLSSVCYFAHLNIFLLTSLRSGFSFLASIQKSP